MNELALTAHNLHKSYRLGKTHLHVLRGVSVEIRAGEFVAVVGASGSGKSTLLHLLGLLDRPDRGELHLGGVDAASLPAGQRNRMRCEQIGFVFQFYHLLSELNVLENVLLPAKVDSSTLAWPGRRAERRDRAAELLERMGLAERMRHRPSELSGGERQRVAIARALINGPKLLLADEPTGNLDSRTGREILDVLREFHAGGAQTVVMVTHDAALASRADRTLHLRDGRMEDGG